MLPRPHVLCYDKHGFIPWSQSTRLSREGALGPLSFISERQYIEQSTDNQQDQSAVNRTELQQLISLTIPLVLAMDIQKIKHIAPASSLKEVKGWGSARIDQSEQRISLLMDSTPF